MKGRMSHAECKCSDGCDTDTDTDTDTDSMRGPCMHPCSSTSTTRSKQQSAHAHTHSLHAIHAATRPSLRRCCCCLRSLARRHRRPFGSLMEGATVEKFQNFRTIQKRMAKHLALYLDPLSNSGSTQAAALSPSMHFCSCTPPGIESMSTAATLHHAHVNHQNHINYHPHLHTGAALSVTRITIPTLSLSIIKDESLSDTPPHSPVHLQPLQQQPHHLTFCQQLTAAAETLKARIEDFYSTNELIIA
ncbi:hypothetical protein BJ741DRAFT_12356 [Chytriomyces cf. hyalinus JEL632]|nr:hypothetical protein BJ741DRAFT_12356 [Chytriomyces cf. hyalinus JEL632]